jgi:hypothetical protein
MGTVEFALVISGVALTVGIGNLIWNIWSKFIQPKPRIKIGFAVMMIAVEYDGVLARQAICISATNFGPNDVVINGVVGLSKRFTNLRFETQSFIVLATSAWPLIGQKQLQDTGNLPARIAVGDSVSWYMPMDNSYFTENDMTHFGLADTFGRTHWVKGQPVNSVRKRILEYLKEKQLNTDPSE